MAAILLLLLAFAFAPGALAQAPPDRVPLADWQPLPAAGERPPSAAAVAARDRLLGPRWSDPRHVTLNWVGVSSFVVTMRGHLFLFDAWEIVGVHRDYLPIGREDLAALEPEAIFIGHGHFDHAADAGYVAGRSGAVVVASEEQCSTVKADARREGNEGRFSCLITGTQSVPAAGSIDQVRVWEDVEPVSILKHVHSAATEPSDENRPDPFLPVFDPAPYVERLNGSPDELATFLGTLGDAEGGTRMYHFRDGAFTLLLGDSAGPIFDHPRVGEALDRLPGCVDVMANAILGFDQPVSGLQDPVLYVAAAHPKVFVPTHADAWAPALSAGQAAYHERLTRDLGRLESPPELDHLLDPGDYLRERAYRVDDPRWEPPMPGSSCAPDPARLSLAVSPARARLGQATLFRFRVTARLAGRRSPIAGAKVRLGRRRAITDADGRATIPYRLTHRDARRRPSAVKEGFLPGRARVRVLPAR
ncbi:MAG TPA: MBL fold metallo-hydrolase [Thermoleophilaceae bacterium]|nr:MBL fold metallo-hydrolase [Thermoleophilaceae bacterium]